MRLFERATRINEEVLRPSNPESARASWFIRDLFPLSGYGSDDTDLFERVLAIREKNARSRRSSHGRKPEQSRRGAVQRRGLSTERDRCSSEPLRRRRDSWARTIQRWQPPRPISPTCCRGPARTTRPRPLYERAAEHLGEVARCGPPEGGDRPGESRSLPPEDRQLR